MSIVKNISANQHRTDLPDIKVGSTVKVHQKIQEGDKSRVQIFEGLVIARKGGKGANSTFTVRKISGGIGVERIYPIHSPNIAKLEIVKEPAVRSAKLYYVRGRQDNSPRYKKSSIRKGKMTKKPVKEAK